MRYLFGGFVRAVTAVPNPDADAPPVGLDDLCGWLEAHGFAAYHREPTVAVYKNGRFLLGDDPRQEIEVIAHAVGCEVSSVRCRFLLAPDAPARLVRWEQFVHQVCETFSLRIGVLDDEDVGPEAFVELVRAQDNWRYFAAEYGWPSSPDE